MRFGFVSFLGRPNAGKSTLLNRVVGAKVAIVSDKPQTTRTRILAVRNYPDAQVVFLDTPGIHRPLHRMNVRMVDTALETLRQVDVPVLVVDAGEPAGRGTRFVIEALRDVRKPVVLALNKIDLVARPALLPVIDWFSRQRDFAEIVPISALTGDGVDRLESALIARLPEGDPIYPEDFLTDQAERALAAELVREKLLQHTRAEIPFATAVIVERFEDARERDLIRIYVTILVEQASQKPIVIGRGGSMLKRIGTEARLELERFFGARVFLDLHVKVRSDWRDDEAWLRRLGMGNE